MSKSDVVSAQKAAILAAQDAALDAGLGACFDAGGEGGGGLSQADVDAAVKAAVDPLNQQIADLQAKDAADLQALADAQAKAVSDLAALQAKLDDSIAKEQVEEGLVKGLQDSVAAVQSSLDAIKAAVSAVLGG